MIGKIWSKIYVESLSVHHSSQSNSNIVVSSGLVRGRIDSVPEEPANFAQPNLQSNCILSESNQRIPVRNRTASIPQELNHSVLSNLQTSCLSTETSQWGSRVRNWLNETNFVEGSRKWLRKNRKNLFNYKQYTIFIVNLSVFCWAFWHWAFWHWHFETGRFEACVLTLGLLSLAFWQGRFDTCRFDGCFDTWCFGI